MGTLARPLTKLAWQGPPLNPRVHFFLSNGLKTGFFPCISKSGPLRDVNEWHLLREGSHKGQLQTKPKTNMEDWVTYSLPFGLVTKTPLSLRWGVSITHLLRLFFMNSMKWTEIGLKVRDAKRLVEIKSILRWFWKGFCRSVHAGSLIPRLAHVTKSWHGGNVPTFEPQDTI